MRLNDLFEAVNESSINQLRSIGANLASFIEYDLTNLMHDSFGRLVDNHADKPFKKLKFVLGSRKARWFNANYLSSRAKRIQGIQPALVDALKDPRFQSAKHELKTLARLPIQSHTPTRMATEQTSSKHFATLVQLLPNVLDVIGNYSTNGESLKSVASRIRSAQAKFSRALQKLKDEYYGTSEPVRRPPTVPRNELPGQQATDVEGIVNQTIKELVPKQLQGEVRNKIARADNKLAALQAELNRLGIKT